MHFHIVSIFPEIFDNFFQTSIIWKSIQSWKIKKTIYNPRDYTKDKHKQIDDEIYWWGAWLLIKAKPIIDCVNDIISNISKDNFKIIYLSPSDKIWNQSMAKDYFTKYDNIILISGRYEGIDYRFEKYFYDKFPDKFEKISIWKYILFGWELASMVLVESISRYIPWVVQDYQSVVDESYSPSKNMENIEYPQYTRPYEVCGYKVPDVLLSWNHKKINDWREENLQ